MKFNQYALANGLWWVLEKYCMIIRGWQFGSGAVNRQNESVKTELNNTFAAYIRWSVQWPQACFSKSCTHHSVLRSVSLVWIFHCITMFPPIDKIQRQHFSIWVCQQSCIFFFSLILFVIHTIPCLRIFGVIVILKTEYPSFTIWTLVSWQLIQESINLLIN